MIASGPCPSGIKLRYNPPIEPGSARPFCRPQQREEALSESRLAGSLITTRYSRQESYECQSSAHSSGSGTVPNLASMENARARRGNHVGIGDLGRLLYGRTEDAAIIAREKKDKATRTNFAPISP